MNQVSNFLTKHWKALSLFALVITSFNNLENKQSNLANAQVELTTRIEKVKADQAEQMLFIKEKVSTIEILANRIDERTRYEAKVRRQKDFEKDQ